MWDGRAVQGSFTCCCVPLGPLLPCLCLAGPGPLLLLVEVSTINSHLILLWPVSGWREEKGGDSQERRTPWEGLRAKGQSWGPRMLGGGLAWEASEEDANDSVLDGGTRV